MYVAMSRANPRVHKAVSELYSYFIRKMFLLLSGYSDKGTNTNEKTCSYPGFSKHGTPEVATADFRSWYLLRTIYLKVFK